MDAAAVLGRVGRTARARGPLPVVVACGGWAAGYLTGRAALRLRAGLPASFAVDGEPVPYFRHRYQHSWLTERAVEVALARRVLAGRPPGDRVLEIGNVLAHYLPVDHEVVDKYERAPGVRNLDVVDLSPAVVAPADLILSVSTLEHVGLDEPEPDPGKPLRALRTLAGLLAPGGTLWITHPVGYNPDLDAALRSGAVPFDRLTALRRERHRNRWRQVAVDEVWDVPYDRLLYTAHGLLVGELSRA